MEEIEKNDYNLNISRYISTAKQEKIIDLQSVNKNLIDLEKSIVEYTKLHSSFLKELGLPELPIS